MRGINNVRKTKGRYTASIRSSILALMIIAPMLVFNGCTSEKNGGSTPFLFSANGGQMQVGSMVSVTYSGSAVSMAAPTWSVTDPTGATVAFAVSGESTITFLAQMGGTYTITVSDGTNSDKSTIDVAQPPGTNTAFGFVMTIKDANNVVVGVLSTDPTKNSGDYILKRGAPYTLNFSPLPDPSTSLSYSIAGAGVSGQGVTIQRTCTAVGAIPIVAKAMNGEGQTNQVIYTEYCQCDTAGDTLAIDASKITFTQDAAAPNVFSFNASAAVTGGSAPYLYNWAPESTLVYSGWVSANPKKLGRIFADSKPGSLKVMDSCYFVHGVNFTHNFNITLADGVTGTPQGPQENNLYFLQGLLTGLNPAGQSDIYVNGRNYIAIKPANGVFNAGVVVTPDYSINNGNATFSLLGQNIYVAADGTARDILHGGSIQISGIHETAGAATADTSNASISVFRYITDSMGDGLASKTYNKVGTCPLDLSVKIAVATMPCGDGTSVTQVTRTIDGTYNCPMLTAPDGSQMKLTQGAFYAEVSKSDECIGGGGQGGGGQPPRPR